jgi:hypothetical protein
MYAEHIPQINAGMRDCPEVFARGVMFSILSIRQPITRIPKMLRDLDKNGENSTALNPAMKFDGWQYMQDHATATWRDVCALDTRDALVRLLAVPSLGIVKAAFVLQFLGHDIACLDTHNLNKLGLSLRTFANHCRTGRSHTGGFTSRQIDLYFSLAATHGRAESFWDTWCNERAPAYGITGDEISALHLEIIR